MWLRIAGREQRPWLTLVTNQTNDLVLAHEFTETQPGPDELWQKLKDAMQSSELAAPHRPAMVQFRSPQLRLGVQRQLEAIGIDSMVAEQLDQLEFVLQEMAKHFGGRLMRPAVVDVPGISRDQVRSFFIAAANFV